MKSCLSTRRKWQLSSLKMIVAARGASFSKASCPKSSPSCSVVTRPCVCTRCFQHYNIPGTISKATIHLTIDNSQIYYFYFLQAVNGFTFPCVITFTEPFQMMYQDVPLSPWLNTTPHNNNNRPSFTSFTCVRVSNHHKCTITFKGHPRTIGFIMYDFHIQDGQRVRREEQIEKTQDDLISSTEVMMFEYSWCYTWFVVQERMLSVPQCVQ